MLSKAGWQQCDTTTFWNDIARDDHVVQIYEDDSVLMNTLTDYAANGFINQDSVVIIATGAHLEELSLRLGSLGFNLENLIATDRFIPLNAAELLSSFMVNGSPDEKYFLQSIGPVIERARKSGLHICAFGEMVALLWEHGNSNATLQVEQMWNKFCENEKLCLFCAYPKSGFSQDAGASIMHICTAHNMVIASKPDSPARIQYQKVG